MKKITAFLLAFLLLLVFSFCTPEEKSDVTDSSEQPKIVEEKKPSNSESNQESETKGEEDEGGWTSRY